MAVSHVGADDEKDVGLFEVLIGTGRPVRAERQLVAGARTGHAQS